MGAAASLPREGGDAAWFMGLIDTERKEKQWLAQQYDSKCAEAKALQQELQELQRLLLPGTGQTGESREDSAPASNKSRPEFLQPGLEPAVANWQLGPVKEHVPSAGGQESPQSPASPSSSSRSLKERRGLRLSVDTTSGKKRSPVPPTSAKQDEVAETAPASSQTEVAPARRGSLAACRPPSLLREDRLHRRSLSNLAEVEVPTADADQLLKVQAPKLHVLDAPASPKRLMLTSQKTWEADKGTAAAA